MKLNMIKHNQKGLLITFCGLDGCGKTTQIRLLKEMLSQLDVSVKLTKQPTDEIRNSEMFRAYQDETRKEKYDYRAVSLICAADRLQHSNHVILPMLAKGDIVISDRYCYSCIANLRARGYSEDKWIYEILENIPKPDFAFFLDVDTDTAINRVRERVTEKDKYIDKVFQERLRKEYLELARDNGGIIIGTGKSPEESFAEIRAALLK